MSRVGKLPVAVPQDVQVSIVDGVFTAKGKLGTNEVKILQGSQAVIENNEILVTPVGDDKYAKMAWGTTRQLINNAVIGVSKGFERKLEIAGVGFKWAVSGSNLKLNIGFSHEVNFAIPSDVKMKIEGEKQQVLVVSGYNRQRVGQVAANVREYKKPEPYKGKGIKYSDEIVLRKEGKKK